jgi:membrane protease YdiL (CAAX protease family)
LFWIRTGIIVILRTRPQPGLNFGFIPSAREWKVGFLCYAALLPPLSVVLLATGFARLAPVSPLWKLALVAAGTFLGILWVVALGEEFLFRGLLQQWVERWTGSAIAALLVASTLFGLVHLGFRQFPNWRFAVLAALAGLFYGTAFRRGGGVRAAMVCHALTVATWRALFR